MGTQCKYNTFTNPAEPTTATDPAPENPSLCGFNKDGMAFCPLKKGDEPFQTPLKAYQSMIAGANTKCNPASAGPGMCNAISSDADATTVVNFGKAQGLSSPQGWPNVANNNGCVESTYTLFYWNGNAAVLSFAAVGAIALLF
jgi:hypothetical protein